MVLINLIIKAPNQRLEDQTISCDLEWTVFSLKSHLSTAYPTKPRIEDQRLIYSGHLLKNEQSLRDVLQPIDDNLTFTIHLVCAQKPHDSPKRNNNTNNNNMAANNGSQRLSNSNSPESQTSDNNQRNNVNINGINYNPLNATPNFVNPSFGMGFTNGSVMATPEQMLQHMALLQQAYAQYMTQYFGQNVYLNNQMGTQPIFNNQTIPNAVPPMAAQQPIVTAAPQAQPVPQVNPQQIQPQPPQIQRLNAGPGGGPAVDDEDDPNNRDWLDSFYWMSRAVVLFSIIYFYSSFNRFLLVVVLTVLLYLYQINWFNRRRLTPNNNNNNLNAAQFAANNNNNNGNDTEIIRNDENEELNDNLEETEIIERPRPRLNANVATTDPRPTEERFTALRFFWVIVSSLFTSLIPENPAVPVNLN
jgi:hypothetical protein